MNQANPNNILLLWTDPKERQALFKILCATGAEVQYGNPDDNGGFNLPKNHCRLVVFDYDSLRTNAENLLQQIAQFKRPPAVLVVTATRNKEDLIELLSHEALTNLIAKNVDVKATELVVTVQKIMRNDIFGFEKYLTWGVQAYEDIISSSELKMTIIDKLEVYLGQIGCNRRLIGLAKGVADEFIMNAVYNAPTDDSGNAKYASLTRSHGIKLAPNEQAVFRYACDGRTLALSISDNFGRLARSTVLSYLRKCFIKGSEQIDQKEGGAGLGLYYIFESLNHLVINVAPGKRTEMIGLMDISGSYREFAERPKSLNLFLQESFR